MFNIFIFFAIFDKSSQHKANSSQYRYRTCLGLTFRRIAKQQKLKIVNCTPGAGERLEPGATADGKRTGSATLAKSNQIYLLLRRQNHLRVEDPCPPYPGSCTAGHTSSPRRESCPSGCKQI